MVYLRPAWLMVGALAASCMGMASAQPASAPAVRPAPSTASNAAESLAQQQKKATLAAMQASVEKQRAAVAAGVASSIGASPARSESTTPDAFFTLPPMPTPDNSPAFNATRTMGEIPGAPQPGLYCEPVSETDLAPIVLDTAQREGLAPRLLTAVIEQESAFRPCAVSAKGAQGLMQLMPATAGQFGVRDPFDIQENIGGGARLLKELLTRYTGDLALALGAYNAGPAKVDQAGGVPAIPETAHYVREILRKLASPSADPKPPVE